MNEQPTPNEVRGGTAVKDSPSIIQPEHWETLLRAAGEANHIFPQSFFPQGIRLAQRMTRIASDDRIPLGLFLASDPEDSTIRKSLGPERIRAHAAHGFQTIPRTTVDLPSIWNSDKRAATDILVSVAGLVFETRPDFIHPATSSEALLNAVQNEPVFQGLLESASQVLDLPETTALSITYKGQISEFMKKYPPSNHDKPIPPPYRKDLDQLLENLDDMILFTALKTHKSLITYVQNQHPGETKLLTKLRKTPLQKLFKDTDVRGIDPLKVYKPRYQQGQF